MFAVKLANFLIFTVLEGFSRKKSFLITVKLHRSHNYEYNDDNKVKNCQFSLQVGFSSLRTSLVVFGNIPKESGIVGKWPKIP